MERINSVYRFMIEQVRGLKRGRGDSPRFRNYYLKIENDSKSILAKTFDYLTWGIIMSCILFLFSYLKTGRLYLSIIITLVTAIVFHLIFMRNRSIRFQQMKKQKRLHIARRKVYNEIMNKTAGEMADYIKEIFISMGFNQLEFVENTQKRVLLKSLYRDNKIMILFNIYRNDLDVELREVKEFIYTMANNGVKKGILITTSDFTKDGRDFINKLSKNYALLLVNKKQLLNIIEKNGFFPDEKEIDEIIENEICRESNRLHRYRDAALSKNKIKGYIILSLYLILTAWYTPYTVYYMIVAGLILALAFVTFVFNIGYNPETEKDEHADFKELLNNM
ncbi:MAG: restriction endonuclease [Natronincolaceae bacterium]|jgi:hypothetical protein